MSGKDGELAVLLKELCFLLDKLASIVAALAFCLVSSEAEMIEFLSDPNFGYLLLETNLDRAGIISDIKLMFGVSNGIEALENPYLAASKALRMSKRYKVNPFLGELYLGQSATMSFDNRFKGAENKIAIGVEKSLEIELGSGPIN